MHACYAVAEWGRAFSQRNEARKMRYKLALFDFDGTLADSAEWFLAQINAVANEMGFRRIESADYQKVRGFSSQQVIAYLGLPMWKLPTLMARMRKAAALNPGAIQLFPGVGEMLKDLEGFGIRVGIVSSNSEANIRRILGEQHAARISCFSGGASLFGKAAKLRGVLRQSGMTAGSVIYIGDEIRDAVAARAAGMAFGAVGWGFTTIEALRKEGPDLEFGRIGEIAATLAAV